MREEEKKGAKQRGLRHRAEDQEENQESLWLRWQGYIGKRSCGEGREAIGLERVRIKDRVCQPG